MKKWIAPIIALICMAIGLAIVLFSCSGNGDPGTTQPSATTTVADTTPVETTPAPAETTLPETTPAPTDPPQTTPVETTPPETTPPETTPAPTQPSGGSSPGGTGGFEGGSTGEIPKPQPKPEEELTVPEIGSDTNPFAESVLALPDAFSTVSIPAGGSVSYRITGLKGNTLTISDPDATAVLDGKTYKAENGVLTVPVPGGEDVPVLVTLGNQSAQEKALTLQIAAPVGAQSNPQVLDAIDQITTPFTPYQSQYYYTWTATESGKLTLKADSVTPGGAGVTIGMTSGENAGTADANGTCLEVTRGDEVTILVSLTPAGEGSASITGIFEPSLGTQSNPIQILNVEQPYVASVPAGQTTFYCGYLSEMTVTVENAQGLTLTVGEDQILGDENGPLTYVFPAFTGMGRPAPDVFALTNADGEAKDYTLVFTYPVGSPMNPDELLMGENSATILPDSPDGYNYVWTAPADGKLTLTMQESNWQYVLSNETAGVYGDIQDAAMEPSAATVTLEVSAGDRITLSVNGFTSQDPWALPGGTVSFTAQFDRLAGTLDNPIVYTGQFPIVTETIPAGQTLYYSVWGANSLVMSCDDPDASLSVNGVPYDGSALSGDRRQPILIGITNQGQTDKAFTVNLTSPLGAYNNPAELVIGENTVTLPADQADGYNYTWTAPADGTLTITMDGTAWQYMLNNMTGFIYGDLKTGDVPENGVAALEVNAGDQITMNLNTFDPESYSTPAGTIRFTAAFAQKQGTQDNPISIYDLSLPFETQVPAGQTLVYSGRIYDVELVVENVPGLSLTFNGTTYQADQDGKLTVSFPEASGMGKPQPVHFTLTNSGAAQLNCLLNFVYPEGSLQNPAQLSLGQNTATLEEGSMEGYNYTWTAPENGELTVTMQGTLWQYTLSNVTSGIYGSIHTSGDSPTVSSETIEVAAGDQITLSVSTFDPDSMGVPAGTVSFTAELAVETLGTQEKPIEVYGEFPIVTPEIPAGQTLYYLVYQCNGMIISTDGQLTVNGEAYDGDPLSGMRGQPSSVAVTNDSDEPKSFTLDFQVPKGSLMNPDSLSLGQTEIAVARGNAEGYLYKWTAPEDGTLVITMTGPAWQYVLSNQSTGAAGSIKASDVAGDALSVMQVAKGQTVTLTVNSYDPQNPYGYPGGTVRFTAAFEAGKELKVQTLASANGGELAAIDSDTLAYNGWLVLHISSVTDAQTGKAVDYTLSDGAGQIQGSGDQALTVRREAAQDGSYRWTVAQEGGSAVKVSYALVYLYEEVPQTQPATLEAEEPEAPAAPEGEEPEAPAAPEGEEPEAPAAPEGEEPEAPAASEGEEPEAPVDPENTEPVDPASEAQTNS